MGRLSPEVVYLKGDIYTVGGWSFNNELINSIGKYSLTSKTLSQVAEINDDREDFRVSAFINKIFVIGGNKGDRRTNSSSQFDTSDCSLEKFLK